MMLFRGIRHQTAALVCGYQRQSTLIRVCAFRRAFSSSSSSAGRDKFGGVRINKYLFC
jgi:AraC-like DNA-binding protein